jgi:membrane protease YdiL (CAAX protease family)
MRSLLDHPEPMPDPPNTRMIAWAVLALVYIVIRFAFTRWLDALGNYGSYLFEVGDVSIAAILAGRSLLSRFKVNRMVSVGAVIGLVSGFGVYRIAGLASIPIPFDLKSAETIVMLLVVAPLLEESIFRFFLWDPIEWLSRRPLVAWIVTTLVFSYSDLHAIWFVPKEIQMFVIYQTVYTLGLGLACGYFVCKCRSIGGAIAIHFSFNLGFYLAFLT